MFSFSPDQAIATFSESEAFSQTAENERDIVKVGVRENALSSSSNQFCIFQFNPSEDGPSLIDSSEVTPSFTGSAESPDVQAALEMLSFHLGESEDVDKDTRATMRINFGKDEKSTDRNFDTVFWSIAAGLSLYDEALGKPAKSTDIKSDFRAAFGNRPIDVPGGLGLFSFEVVKHEERPWWRKIFPFFGSKTAERLISVLGFPAITVSAIRVIDELLTRIGDNMNEPLFKSRPMTLALTGKARDDFTGGNANVKVGALSKGFFVLARGRDYRLFNEEPLTYYPTHDKLVPRNVTQEQLVTGAYDDPLTDVTYAIFRVGMQEAKLDPKFDFSA